MAEDLVKLRRERAVHRGQVTKSIKAIQQHLNEPDSDNYEVTIKGLANLLRSKLTLLDELDMKIIGVVEEDQVETESEESGKYTTDIHICLASVEKALLSSHPTPVSRTSSTAERDSSASVKLPKLEIASFDGDPKKYTAFRDSFDSSIDSNDTLSDVQKLLYLKGLLKGEALNSIEGLQMTNENYREAKEIIRKRFGDKRLLISSFMAALSNLKPVEHSRELNKLRGLYDNIEKYIRNLKSLGINSSAYGPVLIPSILQKLPSDIRLTVTKRTSGDDWDFDAVLQAFHQELSAREKCHFVSEPREGQRKDKPKHEKPHTGSALHSSGEAGKKVDPSCIYCSSKDHKPWDCKVVPDYDSRKQICISQRRCFICLKTGHGSRKCYSKHNCYNCAARHHSSLCDKFKSPPNQEKEDDQIEEATQSNLSKSNEVIFLHTAKADVCSLSGNAQERTRLLFDNGSQQSYISKRMREKLGLSTISSRPLMINGFGSQTSRISNCDIVQLAVKTNTPGLRIIISANVVDSVCAPIVNQPISIARDKYPFLRGLCLADEHSDDDKLEVDLLIGMDSYYQFMTGVNKHGDVNGPMATLTKLGWVVGGSLQVDNRGKRDEYNALATHALKCSDVCNDNLPDDVNKFWDLESIGIRHDENSVYDDFTNSIKFVESDNLYEVRLPWKPAHPVLPNNYSNAVTRLQSTIAKLRKTPDILKQYADIFDDQFERGIIEVCPETDDQDEGEVIHYLPHRPVLRDDKETTKCRIVFDGSAKKDKRSPSLNDCLFTGPPMTPLIFDILQRFRVHPIAFICDLKQAFLQISVHESDRDALRFLWYDDPFATDPKLVIRRFTRVIFGLNCSPFLLNGTIRQHVEKFSLEYPELVSQIIRSLYVDDFSGGANDVHDGYDLYKGFVDVLEKGGFTAHKFVTNNDELRHLVEGTSESNSSMDKSNLSKVLGLSWDVKGDRLILDFQDIANCARNLPHTKRSMLKVLAKVYDPLGFVSPVILFAKILFQEICRAKLGWDDQLPKGIASKWISWINDLEEAREYSVPRCYHYGKTVSLSLHGFCDASDDGYAANVYLRAIDSMGLISCNLMCSKTRVAPIAKQSTPRLELLACLILSRLITKVLAATNREFSIEEVHLWTDSTINLCRIRCLNRDFKQFVQNRLNEIRKLTNAFNWHYVPSNLNCSDLSSRGCLLSQLLDSTTWEKGAAFLYEDDFDYDSYEKQLTITHVDDEMKPGHVETDESEQSHGLTLVAMDEETKKTDMTGDVMEVIDIDNYSELNRLLRVTCYVRRVKKTNRSVGEISADEMAAALQLWILATQRRERGDDQRRFRKTAANLRLQPDENGVLRCRTRLGQSNLSEGIKHPIYLPNAAKLTVLLVRDSHDIVLHSGVSDTLNEFRSNYWTPSGRRTVRKILRDCGLCRRFESMPFPSAPMADLPNYRVEAAPAFSSVGIDHAGPLFIKQNYTRRKLYKCYIAIVTCTVSRAIHLELQPDLSAPSLIRCMKRCFSRRGTPSLAISDNHKTFRSKPIRNFATQNYIKWKYILEKTPQWGGFYERLIGLVKRLLRKQLKTARLTYEELQTVITQIEGVLNSRPLTHIADDDTREAITPNHLIYGRRLNSRAMLSMDKLTPTKRLRHVRDVIAKFWNRFSNEYMTQLRERHIGHKGILSTVNVGDILLVISKRLPRSQWQMGRVERLVTTKDGVIRGATLRLSDQSVINRPITLLCPLEMVDPLNENPGSNRDRRRAAIDGEAIRRAAIQ